IPPVAVEALILAGVASCMVFTLILESHKIRGRGLLIAGLWLVVFCFVLQADILNGLRLTVNHINQIMGRTFGRIYPIYDVSVEIGGYALSATLFFTPICVLLGLLCSYMAHSRDVVVSLILTAALICANVLFKIEMGIIWLVVLIFTQFILLGQAFETRKDFYKGASRSYHKAVMVAAAVFCVLFVVAFVASPSYNSSPLLNAREGFVRRVDRLRYGSNDSLGMPDGDFTEIKDFNPSNETAIEVTMETPTSLWMRGYVGARYNGRGWRPDEPEKLYEHADLFYWLHEDDFYGQKQLVDSALVTGEEVSERAFGIRVKNVGASSRNIYAPYEVYVTDSRLMPSDGIGDKALVGTGFSGVREYEYYSLPNLVKRYPDMIRGLYGEEKKSMLYIESFLAVESNYAQFVYNQYTELPEDVEAWTDEYLQDVLPKKEDANYAEVKQAIIKYLTEQTTYSTEVSQPKSGDFAYDFLFLDKKGYSLHYATAATLMFRASGIPARYVEGYIMTPQDVKDVPENSTLKLNGTHAHAWVEVYQRGVGWIPVEVTPPYFGLMEEADSLEGVPGASSSTGDGFSTDEEIIEEQTESLEEIDGGKEETGSSPLIWVAIIIVIVAAVLGWLLLRYFRKNKLWVQERASKCLHEDNNTAVVAMFICVMDALAAFGLKDRGVWLANVLMVESREVLAVSAEKIEDVFYIYEEAAYSSKTLSGEKRRKVELFIKELESCLKESFRGVKQCKVYRLRKLFAAITPHFNTNDVDTV
ncbi:MAG: DUF3488 and transglutaminase-like domain-containing protein, partial [Christensenellales bacterium]